MFENNKFFDYPAQVSYKFVGDNDEYKDGFYTSYPNITDTDGFFICRLRKQAEPAPMSRAEFD